MQTKNERGARGCVRGDAGWKLMHNGRTKNNATQLSEVTDLVQLSDFLCSDIFDERCERFRGFGVAEFLDSKTKRTFLKGALPKFPGAFFLSAAERWRPRVV